MNHPIRPNQGIQATVLQTAQNEQELEKRKQALISIWLTMVGLKLAQASANETMALLNPNREFKKLLGDIRDNSKNKVGQLLVFSEQKFEEQFKALSALFTPVGGLQTVFIQLSMVNECDMDRCVDEILATIDRHLPKKETSETANFENVRTLLESKDFEIQEHASSYKATYKKLTIDVTSGNIAFVNCVGYESKIQLWEWTVGEVCQMIEPLIFKQNR